MRKSKMNVEGSFSEKLKAIFGDFQFIVNTAIDDDDIKSFVVYGCKHILKKEKKFLILNVVGLFMLLVGIFRFIGLCIFLATLSYISVQILKFLSGSDNRIFEEIKVELKKEDNISQTTLSEYVAARVNSAKIEKRQTRRRDIR